MELNDAIRKIQLLRALSARAGTQEEAAAAAGKAAALMAQYELDEATVTTSEPPEEVASHGMVELKRKSSWKGYVANAVAEAHGCNAYWSYDGLHAIGRKRDVQAAAYLFQLICEDIERLAKEGWEKAKVGAYETKARWMGGFRQGAAQKVQLAVSNARYEAKRQRDSMATAARFAGQPEPQALVVIRNRERRVEDVSRELGLRSGRRAAIRSWSGFDAGRRTNVNTGGNAVASLGAGRARVTS